MTQTFDEATLARRIEAYLGEQVGREVSVRGLRRFTVGFSWLTYGMTVRGLGGAGGGAHANADGGAHANADGDVGGGAERELILRLGSDAGLFAPYGARPQVLAMQALAGSAVPVPEAYWHSDDESLLGAPFMFCEKVAGSAVVPWVSPSAPPLEEGYRRGLGAQFIDALAALHRLRWQGEPIAELAALTPGIDEGNAALLTVQTWEALVERWAMRPYPLAEWGIRWLEAHAPAAPRVAVVHGDYRTGNFLEQGGRITAILDWELVHLSDPHEDLAWASLPMYMGGSPYLGRLCEPDWFFERYAEQAGLAVSMDSVHYWQVFSFLKLAATHMAAARCFEEGRSSDMRMPAMGSQIATCLRQMEKAIERGIRRGSA